MLLSGGGLLLCSCCFAVFGPAPGKEIFGQRVQARLVDCLKLPRLDAIQPSCLSFLPLLKLRYVLVALTYRDTADSDSTKSGNCLIKISLILLYNTKNVFEKCYHRSCIFLYYSTYLKLRFFYLYINLTGFLNWGLP